jgi:lysophospholipase L1-like esterase
VKILNLADRAIKPIAAFAVLASLIATAAAQSKPDKQTRTLLAAAPPAASVPCNVPMDLLRLANPLARVARKLRAGDPITIVALGSSSTAGTGASSDQATYPSRLAQYLRQRFPKNTITVLNKGVGGEEAPDMLKRFDKSVAANKPDLVLWQLGTNALIRDHKLNVPGGSMRDGLRMIRATGADVVLIDPQFAPKVIAKPEALHMIEYMAAIAKQEGADLFRRFHVMKRWSEVVHMPVSNFV